MLRPWALLVIMAAVMACRSPSDLAPTEGAYAHYVIDQVQLPTSITQALEDGADLDGTGQVKNSLGERLASFAGQGFDSQPAMTTAIDTGAIILLADLDAYGPEDFGFTTYSGTNPSPIPCASPADTVCRQHLQGTGMFDVAATPRDPELSGTVTNDTFRGGPGRLPVQLTLFGAPPVALDLIGAHVMLYTAFPKGVIAGGVPQSDITGKVYPSLQQAYSAKIAADCTALTSPPHCGCTPNSTGWQVLDGFDANHDCAISVDEIANNVGLQQLFAPDVTIEGQPALSLGFAITAVPATFTP